MLEFAQDKRPCHPCRLIPNFLHAAEIEDILSRPKGERVADLRRELQVMMMDKASVVRSAESLTEAKQSIAAIRSRYAYAGIDDHGSTFNTDLTEALELGAMIDCAETLVEGALAREESRRRSLPEPIFRTGTTPTAQAYDGAADLRRIRANKEERLHHRVSTERAEILTRMTLLQILPHEHDGGTTLVRSL
jgi:hypothetical protein